MNGSDRQIEDLIFRVKSKQRLDFMKLLCQRTGVFLPAQESNKTGLAVNRFLRGTDKVYEVIAFKFS
jgi:hypothetical protein